MKKYVLLTALIALTISNCFAQLDVQNPGNAGPVGSGSWLRFLSGGDVTSIQENWGLNISGSNIRPVKVINASFLVGYTSVNQDFGIGNALISGRLGIGTQSPQSKLHVQGGGVTIGTNAIGNNANGGLSIGDVTSNYTPTQVNWSSDGSSLLLSGLDYTTIGFHDSGERVDFIRSGHGTIQLGFDAGWGKANIGLPNGVWNSAGDVGVGTTSPQANLEIKSTAVFDASTVVRITNNSADFGRTNLVLTGRFQTGNDAWNFGSRGRNSIVFAQNESASGVNIGATGDEKFSMQLEGNSNALGFLSKQNGSAPNMVLTQNGTVGIGTTSPDPAYRLSVNGSIRSKEVKVEAGWADYVFNSNYVLRPLTEVEAYIKTEGHLPEVPSAAEVAKNGINVGETESLLLKKVEELTLYLIDKDKQLKIHAEKNARLEQRQILLEKRLSELEALLAKKNAKTN